MIITLNPKVKVVDEKLVNTVQTYLKLLAWITGDDTAKVKCDKLDEENSIVCDIPEDMKQFAGLLTTLVEGVVLNSEDEDEDKDTKTIISLLTEIRDELRELNRRIKNGGL
ncbi:hypothetical protein [Sulfolobus polyhedral virus 1]|uniref:Uncharacterized protein n=1 Tax=Sulfolobus polyhedral virus 1 TaxID=1982658 RepID=A0A1W6I145_SPV1|nr:hypothetical protein DT302_gp04 [Sulfolobus polyhedral virus 1]ARM37786.1 hypothetical protein [Sulfolobus polyhedral virus 1]